MATITTKVGKVKWNYKAIGELLKSNEVRKLLYLEASKKPDEQIVITSNGYKYVGKKKYKEVETDRVGLVVNYRENGEKLTNALLNSPDSRSRRLGHIRSSK